MYYTDFNDIPRGGYDVILADPPWSYNDKFKGHSFSLEQHYPTMKAASIGGLPIHELGKKDCALFMWVTSPQLPIGIETMEEWGFGFKTVAFVWAKKTHLGNNVANLGRWTMGSTEMCLLGTKGRPKRVNRSVHQLVESVRGRHSQKPVEVRERINTLMGEGARIELFARGQVEGWDQWGNEPEVP